MGNNKNTNNKKRKSSGNYGILGVIGVLVGALIGETAHRSREAGTRKTAEELAMEENNKDL